MPQRILIVALLAILVAPPTVVGEVPVDAAPVVHQELNRALDDLAGHVHGLGDRWRDHFGRTDSPAERPLITLMLNWRQELGLNASQVESLERLRSEFQREATRRDADVRAAEHELATLLQAQTLNLAVVQAKVRERSSAPTSAWLGSRRSSRGEPSSRPSSAPSSRRFWPGRYRSVWAPSPTEPNFALASLP
jgi:hypothetical protein